MRSTQQLSITLPNELTVVLKAEVTSDEYAGESEVIRDGLRGLTESTRSASMGPSVPAVPHSAVTTASLIRMDSSSRSEGLRVLPKRA